MTQTHNNVTLKICRRIVKISTNYAATQLRKQRKMKNSKIGLSYGKKEKHFNDKF